MNVAVVLVSLVIASIVVGNLTSRAAINRVLCLIRVYWAKKRVCRAIRPHVYAAYCWRGGNSRVLFLIVKEYTDAVCDVATEAQKDLTIGGFEVVVRVLEGRKHSEVVPPGSKRLL